MGDCLRTAKPSRYITNHQGQLSLPSLRGRWIEYRPAWLVLRLGTFSCVKWQITDNASALEVINVMRSINPRFTYLLTSWDQVAGVDIARLVSMCDYLRIGSFSLLQPNCICQLLQAKLMQLLTENKTLHGLSYQRVVFDFYSTENITSTLATTTDGFWLLLSSDNASILTVHMTGI